MHRRRLALLSLLLLGIFFLPACASPQPATETPAARSALVRVEADGETQTIRTHLISPLAIIASLKLSLNSGDAVWVDGALLDPAASPRPTAPHAIVVVRALTLTVYDNGTTSRIRVAARTVGEALWRAGYHLYRADEVEPGWEALPNSAVPITLHRSRPITIQADGQALSTRTRRATVGETLSEIGLALVGEDYSIPAPDQPLPEDGVVRVVRVREEVLTAQETVPYETLFQAMPDQEIDTVTTLQAGVAGLRQRRVRVRYEDGVEVSRVDEGETVVQSPVARLVGYGTHITLRTIDTPDGTLEYWRSFTMYATSYSPARAGTPPTARNYGRTASGRLLTKGLVAIDRRLIPFGTRMYVTGYGFAEAADTGGGVKGRWIDLGYDDWNYVSWHQVVTVYFLTPVPPADTITWIIPATVP